jgi:periplasmic divalent cation tolerance protein
MPDIALFYIPCSNHDEAERIGSHLLNKKIIACANILPAMTSLYTWAGQHEKASETLLLVKSLRTYKDEIEKEVTAQHSYDCPCIMEVAIQGANAAYEQWIRDQVPPK